MKRCPECNAVYEDSYDICPTCGDVLEPFSSGQRQSSQTYSRGEEADYERQHRDERRQDNPGSAAIPIAQSQGGRIIINGAVAESNTQQYYQSAFTKFFNALFSGEPYQLSHTTFVTLFRVEEHVLRGYPEHSRDITVFGNIQNIFAVGDDVTVEAVEKGNRCVAKRIFNHTINSDVHIQPYIAAGVIRAIVFAIIALIGWIIYSIVHVDYAAVGQEVASKASSGLSAILPTVAIVAGVIFCLKNIIKPK